MQSILFQVFAHPEIICKVTIVHQRFMNTNERMRTPWMPHPTFSWISLMCDPTMCAGICEFVILNYLFCKTNRLKHHKIFCMTHYKRTLVTKRSIIFAIDAVTTLKYKFILQ